MASWEALNDHDPRTFIQNGRPARGGRSAMAAGSELVGGLEVGFLAEAECRMTKAGKGLLLE